MKVITLLNTLRHEANFYNPRGDAAKKLLLKMTKKYLPHTTPYEQGCEVALNTRTQLVIKVPYKLPEGFTYVEVYIDEEVNINWHQTYKIVAGWTNEKLNDTPFDPIDLTWIWGNVIADLTAALFKQVTAFDQLYEDKIK